MRFIVDELPKTCRECQYCVDAAVMTQMGVPKPINICALKGMVPPKCQEDEQLIMVSPDENPMKNYCPCKTINGNEEWIESEVIDQVNVKANSIILED